MKRSRHRSDTTLLGRNQTWRWRKLRAVIMRRDMYRCQACRAPAEVVDHIVPRWAGGTDAWDYLQALCGPCHRTKTLAEFPAAVAGQQRLIHGDHPPAPAQSAPPLQIDRIVGYLTKKP